EASKFADLWLAPKQGTDAALAMAVGHVILKEFHLAGKSAYFTQYCRRYTDLPFLVRLEKRGDHYVAGRFLRASDFADAKGQANNPDWKPQVIDEASDAALVPTASVGFPWGEQGKLYLESRDGAIGGEISPRLSLIDKSDAVVSVAFPYFGGKTHAHFANNPQDEILPRNLPARRLATKDGEIFVATVFDLLVA